MVDFYEYNVVVEENEKLKKENMELKYSIQLKDERIRELEFRLRNYERRQL